MNTYLLDVKHLLTTHVIILPTCDTAMFLVIINHILTPLGLA